MGIEPGKHAIDRRLDKFAGIGFLDIFDAHSLEHLAEQAELTIGTGDRRLGA